MSLGGKLATQELPGLKFAGTTVATGIRALLFDGAGLVLLATGTTKPVDTGDIYAKGCIFIDTDVATGTTGLYVNVGTSASCIFTATTATDAEISQAADLTAQDSMTPGAGFAGAGTLFESSVVQHGGIIKTEILLDLTDAASSTTDLDIIGTSGVSYIGQITDAKNGTLMYGQVTCLETPAGGVTDIDLYSATEDTGAFDGAVTDLVETALLTKGGAWTGAVTPTIMAALPVADEYLYLTGGAAGTAATYTGGRFLIEFWGI